MQSLTLQLISVVKTLSSVLIVCLQKYCSWI